MSHLAEELELLMVENGVRPADVARVSKVPEASISRIKTGVQKSISAEDLLKISGGIGKSPRIHARLLKAYLMDEWAERGGPGQKLIKIQLVSEKVYGLKDEPAEEAAKLPPPLRDAVKIFAEHWSTDADLRAMVNSLRNLYEKGTLSS